MTETETSLVHAMMLLAASKAGDFCRDEGYPAPTEEQTAEMSRLWQPAFTAFVAALNPERAELNDDDKAALDAVVGGCAQGAILRVLGRPPGSKGNEN